MSSEEALRIAKALADPSRSELLEMIAASPDITCRVLIERSGLSQPTVSHHLKELGQAGLVRSVRSGTLLQFRVEPERLEAYAAHLGARFGRTA